MATARYYVEVDYLPESYEDDPILLIAQYIEYLLRTEREGLTPRVYAVSPDSTPTS